MKQRNTPVVLVVEDDPPVRTVIGDILHDAGYEVVDALDGTTALKIIQSLRCDLIVLDLELPGLTGGELLDVLHGRPQQIPPVIVVTGAAPVSRRIRQLAQHVLEKPFDVDDLLQHISALLQPRTDYRAAGRRVSRRATRRTKQRQTPDNDPS